MISIAKKKALMTPKGFCWRKCGPAAPGRQDQASAARGGLDRLSPLIGASLVRLHGQPVSEPVGQRTA